MKKRIAVAVITVFLLAALLYMAHTTDLFGLVQRIHGE
jgi:uncharacterized membrane protein YdcZ (DUF606 family)